jgi:hypothetical protein
MEYCFANRVENLPAEALAEVFDRLIWCFADNGQAINAIRGEWLQSTDEHKVEIALSMNEVFPCSTKLELEQQLHRIALQFPRLREKCAMWLDRAKALA